MIGPLLAQVLSTAVASKKQAIHVTLTRALLVAIGTVFGVAAFAFGLVTIYHALTPMHVMPVEAAGLITVGLLLIAGVLVLVAILGHRKPQAATGKPDIQSAELSAIEALGMLNKALTDMGKGRGGATPYLGVLGLAALVGFVSGRKR